jgi:hypothetical protein
MVHLAVATSMATIVFTSLSNMFAHHRHRAVLWPVVRKLVPGILLGSLIGPLIVSGMSSLLLASIFAVFAGFSGIVAHNPEQEEAVEELEARTNTNDLGVGFNVNYLLDALNALQGDEVLLCLRDGNSSCLLRAPSSERSRHVIMPLRL